MGLSAYYPFRSVQAKEEYLAIYDRQAKQWPLESESRMVETSYGQTFVRISGPENAPPLVLLAGRYGNSLMWIPHIEAFSADYKTYAVDCIFDLGRSLPRRRLKASSDFVYWLDELFTALRLGNQICLLGASFGGWQAALYALRFQNRLAKMVLIAPAVTVLPVPLEFYARSLLAMIHPYFFRRHLFWLFEDSVRQDEVSLRELDEFQAETRAALRLLKFDFAYGVFPTMLKDNELKSLKVSTIFIVGEHEKIYSASRAVQRLNTLAPQVKTVIIPQAGHDVLSLQTEMVNNEVLEFLKPS